MRPDWASYWTLGKFSKPLATINLPKFLVNFVKVSKSIIFQVKSFLCNFYRHLSIFSGHTGHDPLGYWDFSLASNWMLLWTKMFWSQSASNRLSSNLSSFSGWKMILWKAKHTLMFIFTMIIFSYETSCTYIAFQNYKKMYQGQWLWLSWQSGRFRYQRSAVRIQSLARFYYEHIYC